LIQIGVKKQQESMSR